jgi:hypothetical protein
VLPTVYGYPYGYPLAYRPYYWGYPSPEYYQSYGVDAAFGFGHPFP